MVLDIIEYSFSLLKNRPKVLLPQVLGWIPAAFFGVIFYFAFLDAMKAGFSNPATTVISLMVKYAAPLVAAVILSYLVTAYIQVVYPDIVRQAFAGKNISLVRAFAAAKSRFWSMVWTDFLVMMLLILGILGIAGITALFSMLPPALSGVSSLVLIIAVLAVVVYIVPGFYMLSTAVTLENLSGLNAIKRSFALAEGRKLSIWGVVFLIVMFSFAISFIQSIPVVGIFLALPANAIIMAWSMNASTTYYFMRVKNAKPKL